MKPPVFSCCQFCGASPESGKRLTKTHIWPHWINNILELHPTCDVISIDRSNPKNPTIQEKKRHQDIFTIQPRMTCKSCNEGWMNDIEQNVLNYLKPIISNNWPASLSPEQASNLSLWLALICMNAELASPLSNTITQNDRDHLRKTGTLPSRGWSIIIGKNEGVFWRKRKGYHNYPSLDSGIHRGLSQSKNHISYDKQITTFGIGSLFAQVVNGRDLSFSDYHSFHAKRLGFGVIFPSQRNSPLLTEHLPVLTDEQINFLNSQEPWFSKIY
ncbi:hypothetical protein [Acetobacter persici]|uniref:hypothetical protein n=1 Tax=Acetobacter persici TaxID=1076596 RepID=UPI0012FDB92D|nr:hypothetical protein [Acetobacter persici]